MNMLNKILSDLLKDIHIVYTISSIPYEKLETLHFSVGMYIRNKYLWHNSANFKALSVFYNTFDIDKISYFIIKDIYFLIHKK